MTLLTPARFVPFPREAFLPIVNRDVSVTMKPESAR